MRYLSYYRALDEGRPMWAFIRVALVWFTVAGAAIGLFFSSAPSGWRRTSSTCPPSLSPVR